MSIRAQRAVERLKRFMERPEVRVLDELERLRLAEKELGLTPIACPKCRGMGCAMCNFDGYVFTMREEN